MERKSSAARELATGNALATLAAVPLVAATPSRLTFVAYLGFAPSDPDTAQRHATDAQATSAAQPARPCAPIVRRPHTRDGFIGRNRKRAAGGRPAPPLLWTRYALPVSSLDPIKPCGADSVIAPTILADLLAPFFCASLRA